MARTGGDLLVRLVHEVGQLKTASSDDVRRIEALEDRMLESATQLQALAVHARKTDATVTRVGKIVARLVATTGTRFDDVNRRLDGAEKAVRAPSRRA